MFENNGQTAGQVCETRNRLDFFGLNSVLLFDLYIGDIPPKNSKEVTFITMNHTYLRGDIYYADLGKGVGSEQEGYRPVVIIQNDVGNKHSPTVIVASITSKKDAKPKLPTHYFISAEDGLELPSLVLLEQIRTIDKRRLRDFIGHLSEKHIHGINHALAVSVGLIDSVPKKLILCLCSTCAENFDGSGAFVLRRVDRKQTEKDTCTYCNHRKGFDYELIPKNR